MPRRFSNCLTPLCFPLAWMWYETGGAGLGHHVGEESGAQKIDPERHPNCISSSLTSLEGHTCKPVERLLYSVRYSIGEFPSLFPRRNPYTFHVRVSCSDSPALRPSKTVISGRDTPMDNALHVSYWTIRSFEASQRCFSSQHRAPLTLWSFCIGRSLR